MSDKLIVPEYYEKKETPAKSNVLAFDVITGGRDGGGLNWLKELSKGTVFLARPKMPNQQPGVQQPFEVSQFQILYKWDVCCKLFVQVEGREVDFNVDMARFSNAMDKVEVIGEVHDDE